MASGRIGESGDSGEPQETVTTWMLLNGKENFSRGLTADGEVLVESTWQASVDEDCKIIVDHHPAIVNCSGTIVEFELGNEYFSLRIPLDDWS
jgi:hypothetical protein